MILIIDLPNSLIERLNEHQIPAEGPKGVATAALEISLAQEHSTNCGRFSKSAVPFVQCLIAENHELFDALAQR
jgi:hypothetical protein